MAEMTDRARMIWTFLVTSVALFMVALDNLVVTTALPVIKHDLGASLAGGGPNHGTRPTPPARSAAHLAPRNSNRDPAEPARRARRL
jgi:hypothetical protein